VLLTLLSLASAGPVALPTAYDAAGVILQGDQMSTTLTSGTLQPLAINGDTVGLILEGEGVVSLSFKDRGEAMAFANRQVLWFGGDRAAMAPVVDGAPWTTTATRGLIVGSDKYLNAIIEGLPEVEPDPQWKPWKRLETLDAAFGVTGKSSMYGDWLITDLQTDTNYGFVRLRGGDDDRWLTQVQTFGRNPEEDVYALGQQERGKNVLAPLLSAPWVAPEPRSPDASTDGARPIELVGTIVAEEGKGGTSVAVSVAATFTLTVTTEPLTVIDVGVPRSEAVRGSWAVTGLSINGTEVSPPDGIQRGARLTLPEPVAKGERVTLEVRYTDTWQSTGMDDLGSMATRLERALPWALSSGTPWPFTLSTSVPADSPLSVAQSGLTTMTWEEDGRRWYQSVNGSHATSTPRVAIGKWVDHFEPSVDGLPAVALHVFPSKAHTLPELPGFSRFVISYYQGLLPSFPVEELELFESPARYGSFTWLATPGLVSLQDMKIYGDEAAVRRLYPHLEQAVMAHEIAHQYWGGLVTPAHIQDSWTSETFAELYACMFVAAAFAPEDCTSRQEDWQELWETSTETRKVASLWHARANEDWYDVAYKYGPFLFGRTLQARIGVNALLGGLDQYAAAHSDRPGSTDGLQAALEATSGQDLSDFFDYWVQGGFLPSLTLEWRADGGHLTSDIPFGTIEVPVKVLYKDRAETLWVPVVDGDGDIMLTEPPTKVLLDPDGVMLAKKRKVSKRR